MSAEQQIHWPVPPQEGYRFEDLFTLPGLPEHTELIDGSLVFMAPQASAHHVVIRLLARHVEAAITPELRVRTRMNVRLTDHTALEPDLMIVSGSSVGDLTRASFAATDVLLAAEVVSPSSAERDRDTKPHKYAGAGIPHFWRIEWMDGAPAAYTYRLGADGRYEPTGEHVGRFRTDEPVGIDVDLTEIERM